MRHGRLNIILITPSITSEAEEGKAFEFIRGDCASDVTLQRTHVQSNGKPSTFLCSQSLSAAHTKSGFSIDLCLACGGTSPQICNICRTLKAMGLVHLTAGYC